MTATLWKNGIYLTALSTGLKEVAGYLHKGLALHKVAKAVSLQLKETGDQHGNF